MVKPSNPRRFLLALLTRQGQVKGRAKLRRKLTETAVRAAIEVVSWSRPDIGWGNEKERAKACWEAIAKAAEPLGIAPYPPADALDSDRSSGYHWDLVSLYCDLLSNGDEQSVLEWLGVLPFRPDKHHKGVEVKSYSDSPKRRRPYTQAQLKRMVPECEKCRRMRIYLFLTGFKENCVLRNVEGSGCSGGLLAWRTPQQVAEAKGKL